MKNRRFRPLIFAALALVAVWGVAWTVYHFAGKSKMTAEKLQAYISANDLSKLSAAQRDRTIGNFADKVNQLSIEERMNWRRGDDWKKWFASMTEAERGKFIEATLPTGFKQMMDAFSQMPDDKRKKFIDNAMQRMKEQGANGMNRSVGDYGKNGPPALSPELEKKVRQLGLKEIYTDSSAETKAELAPLLDELGQQVRGGRMR